MAIVLYHAPQTRALRVLWALEELGIPYERRKLDLAKGEHKTPEYLAINPNGKVPAMVVDGTPMFESSAMVIYLGTRFGVEPGLWPAPGNPLLATALGWSMWEQATLGVDIVRYIHASHERVPQEQHNLAQATATRAAIDEHFAILDARLARDAYMLGASFTFVDLEIANAAIFVQRVGISIARWPALAAWTERVTARAAFARALAI